MNPLQKNFCLLVLLLPVVVTAQEAKDVRRADKDYNLGKYADAARYYSKAYYDVDINKLTIAQQAALLFKVGECYRMMDVPRQEVIWYNKAIKKGYTGAEANQNLTAAQAEIKNSSSSTPIASSSNTTLDSSAAPNTSAVVAPNPTVSTMTATPPIITPTPTVVATNPTPNGAIAIGSPVTPTTTPAANTTHKKSGVRIIPHDTASHK